MFFVKCTSILWSFKEWFTRDQHLVWIISLSVQVYVAYISGIHKFLKQWSRCVVSINTFEPQRVKRREYSSTVRALNLRLERWQNESNAMVVTFSATNLKVVPTCFLTICSCFSWRTDTKVCGSKLTTQFSSSTRFLTKTTCKEWKLKITEKLTFPRF